MIGSAAGEAAAIARPVLMRDRAALQDRATMARLSGFHPRQHNKDDA